MSGVFCKPIFENDLRVLCRLRSKWEFSVAPRIVSLHGLDELFCGATNQPKVKE